MIQAYVDETGTDGRSPELAFSALICRAEIWAKFSDEWSACLEAPPSIKYFKMGEASGPSGEFYRLSLQQRQTKVKELCHVLAKTEAVELSCSMDLAAFDDTWGKTGRRPLSEPYFFPFHIVNIAVAHQVGDLGETEPYEIFFDEQKIFGTRAKAWYPVIRAFQDEPVKSLMPVEPFFRSDLEALPLQASDLLAWMVRYTGDDRPDGFDWLESELNGLNHSMLSTHLNNEWMKRFTQKDTSPEAIAKHEAGLRAYEETFGHAFPPKNVLEIKKMRGR
jgi:hypothetical protein